MNYATTFLPIILYWKQHFYNGILTCFVNRRVVCLFVFFFCVMYHVERKKENDPALEVFQCELSCFVTENRYIWWERARLTSQTCNGYYEWRAGYACDHLHLLVWAIRFFFPCLNHANSMRYHTHIELILCFDPTKWTIHKNSLSFLDNF